MSGGELYAYLHAISKKFSRRCGRGLAAASIYAQGKQNHSERDRSVQRASRRVCDERIFEMSRLSRVRFHHVTIDPTDSDHNDPICPNLFPRKQRFAIQNEMSTSGQKQTYAAQSAMSALPPKADMCSATRHVGTAAHAGPDRLVRDEFQPVD